METELIETPGQESSQAMTSQSVHRQIQLIQEVMKNEMKDGEHYGKVPGCGDKPSLLKAGAEKLSLLFKMAPRFKVENVDLGNGHREVRIVTELYHITTGKFLGEGLGSCSTMETKYRYHNQARTCPACEGKFIIKGKQEYGGGWLCFAKKGGCGAKFADGDPVIESQPMGKVDNPDIADTYNTVLKMGKKRSLVDAVLTATAASDIFTQDIEEFAPENPIPAPRRANPEASAAMEAQAPVQEDPNDVPPGFDDSPEEVISPPTVPPPQKAQAKPAVPRGTSGKEDKSRRMQSTFAGPTCKRCKKPIQKGDWIYKTVVEGWVHESTC